MQWLQAGLTIVAVIMISQFLKYMLIRLMWFGFGIKPDILNESQVKITVRDCSSQFIEQQMASHPDEYATLSTEAVAEIRTGMENYTRWVIEQYIMNFKLPRL